MKMSKRFGLSVVAAVGSAVLLLSGCSAGAGSPEPSSSSETEVQPGGIVKVASYGEMPGFDPVRLQNLGSGIERAANVFDTLLYRDEVTDAVTPKLAKGISTEDGVTWVLELRDGVTFTDGTPLDAEAVIFNLNRHLAEDSTSTAKSMLSGIASMEATTEYEVTFTLKAASGSFPLVLTASSPASLIGSPAALADPEAFNTNPVGAGPFVMKEWVRDATLTFEKNEDYWDEGLPYLDGIEYTVMGDAQTRSDAIISGGVDLTQLNASSWNTAGAIDNLTLLPLSVGGAAVIPNASKAPADDQRVREAIAMAFDSATTANVLLGGTQFSDGNVECVPFPVGSPACAEGAYFTQDLDEAKSLIEEYVKDGGDPTTELVYFSMLQDQATYIQQQLTAIGMTVTLRSVDLAGLAESQSTGDYGIFWGSTASAGFPTVWTRYYSEGTNWGMVAYPELDAALLKARDSVELDDRNAAWREVDEFLHDNAVLEWILPYSAAMTYNNKLHLGLPDFPYEGSSMVYFDHAWLEQ